MLDRIAEVKGVGLLHDANGKPHTCHKATLIYADNGRGKTTLASILRSVSTGNSALVNERKTIDGTLSPKVVLHFEHGHKVEFEKGSWSEQRPELVVFDADFVERNVHSGGTVNTSHRKNLLEFALGESAVAARALVEKTTAESKVAVDKVQNVISQLTGHHVGVTLAQFEKLLKIEEADAKIEELQKRMAAASNVALIVNKAVPAMVAAPTLDIDALFAGFALSLKDVHADAEKTVREHIEALGNTSAEHWLSQGLQFAHGDSCPYCGQEVSGNELISAYQTHFDDAYSELKAKVKASFAAISSGTNSSIVENFSQSIKTSIAYAAAWGEQVSTEAIVFDAMAAGTSLAELQELLVNLSQKKLASPAEAVGSESEKQ